ncbi:MAG: chromosome segregation protein SMC [Streptococcaceae bacterium]|jgi:chromosome segregation protein|nr:chromosome segregation protein SMC [Streptococcaceae bacterium]
MYLKKLEITGFKSFADRTKIEFDHGITAIVGPNGSGKSNITEALRWALGEQSAKSLRGGKMPDVIFAGTEKRKALNFAEVVAHFDNSDAYLDSPAKEVAVTRRLYRNGDSDFLINGKKCRLHDIHDLFLDTGLGRDSFSIISQGRIESVFSSKPEERRAIIEEAAGVLKYKTRKSETQSKLANTQDNLDRLEDIIYELSGQLTPLKAQKEAALQFQSLDADRSKLALSLLVAHVNQEKTKFDQAGADLKETLAQLASLSESQQSFEKELSELKQRRDSAEAEREKLQSQILQLTELKAELERKIERFDRAVSDQEKTDSARSERQTELTAQQAQLNQQIEASTNKTVKLQAEKEKLEQKIQQLERELEDFSVSPETQMERLREAYLELVNKEASLTNQLTRNQTEADNLLRQQSESDSSAQETAEKLAGVSSELESLQSEFAQLKAEIDKLLTDFQEKNLQSQQEIAELEAAGQEQFKLLEKVNKQRAQLNSLENIRENHSNLYAGVRAAMRAQLPGLIGVVADLLAFDQKYETALEVALGGGAQNIITENEQYAQSAIKHLRDNKLGRATFLPLTTIRPRDFRNLAQVSNQTGFIDLASNLVSYDEALHPAISNLLGSTIIVDTADHATQIARSQGFNVRIVTLDGTLLSPGGSYAGGSRQNKNNSTFIANEIKSLSEEVQELDAVLKNKEKTVQELRSRQEATQAELSSLREKGEEKRLQEKEQELKISQLEQNKADLTQLLALSASEAHESQLQALTMQNEEIEQKLSKITEDKQKMDTELDNVKSSSTERNALQAEKATDLTDTKVTLSKINSEKSFAQSEQNRLLADLNKLESELEQLTSNDGVKLDAAERERLSAQLAESTEKLQNANVRQVSLRFERDDLADQMDDLNAQNSVAREEYQTLHDQKTRLELRSEQSEKILRDAQQSLAEDYQLSFDEASAQSDTIEEADQAKKEKDLRSLERQIRAIGPVNLDAIGQYEEVNQRFEFLNSQKSDLLEAKNLLLSNINEMDDEVKVRFKSTFEEIRASFKTTFAQMFGGGVADLVLTSDDLLEAGVDITAQPPGKRLGSLTLMSGGEKALTALALLFAILRVRTVPFVVLDEVEAALDEANVKRFGDYMNHFDNSNQFIVVTHRKGTMAAAKVMYGVTMGDAGVSKIVSVRFDDVKTDKTA